MIFRNAESLLNQLSEEELEEIGVVIEEDGTVSGLPQFPFEVAEKTSTDLGEPFYASSIVVDSALDKSRINFNRPDQFYGV
ncbi:hypothetical protein [Phormidesmis sp. 146-33]